MEYLAQLALYWKDIVGFTLVFSLLTAFFMYLFEFLEKLSTRTRRPQSKSSSSWRTDPKNIGLQAKLLNLLHRDKSTANRLLQQQRRMNPGKSDKWYLEKVIWDLERDRGR